jgi:hypothetical protein
MSLELDIRLPLSVDLITLTHYSVERQYTRVALAGSTSITRVKANGSACVVLLDPLRGVFENFHHLAPTQTEAT